MNLLSLPKIFNSLKKDHKDKSISRRRRRPQEKRTSAVAGVFFRRSTETALLHSDDDTTVCCSTSDHDTIDQSSSSRQSSTSCFPVSWHSTTRQSFCSNQPLVVTDPDSSKELTDEDPVVLLQQAMARDLPANTWYYSSNHVMVNVERRHHMVAPLCRLSALDVMAREHAQAMADDNRLYHADPQEMIEKFTTDTCPSDNSSSTSSVSPSSPKIRIMGENVAAGESIRSIHGDMMLNATHRINILHRGYTHFGMGTAKGSDGRLYMCQVYRG